VFFSRKEKGMKVCTFFFFQGGLRSGGVFVKLTNITPVYCCVRVRLSTCGDMIAALKKEERCFPLRKSSFVGRKMEKCASKYPEIWIDMLQCWDFNHININITHKPKPKPTTVKNNRQKQPQGDHCAYDYKHIYIDTFCSGRLILSYYETTS